MRRQPILLAMGLVLLSACDNGPSLRAVAPVPTSLPTPAAVTATPFGPPDLGITLMVPSTWKPSTVTSGFEYAMRDTGPTHAYLLANIRTVPEGTTPARFAQRRIAYLKTVHGTVESTAGTTVDGHGAARLRYRLTLPGGRAVEDVEYDIARGPTFVVIALGEPAPQTDTPLLDWIMSTVRVST